MRKEDGTTLMELLMAAALLGVFAMMAVPNFLAINSRTQVRCVTEEIASELRFARQLAITHRGRVRVVIDMEQRALVTHVEDVDAPHHTYHYGASGLILEEPTGGVEILFHPSGRSATATTIQLHSTEGLVQKLTVGLTGRVSIL